MRPALAALLSGATCIALSPIFVRIADVGPSASAFWRVALLVRASMAFSVTAIWGDALGVITAIFYAGYILAVKELRDGGAQTLELMAFTTTVTALLLLPVALLSDEAFLPQSARDWLTLIALAWISHCAGQGLIAYSLAHLPAAFSSVSLLFQPVMAGLFGWLILGEALAPLQIAGGAIVLAGIYAARPRAR